MPDGAPAPPETNSDERTVGELVIDISEQASGLIREEIELAKTEVSEKVNKILRRLGGGIVAGVFVLMALAMFMHGVAWLLNDLFFEENVWLGFLVEALFWLLVGIAAGLFAWRSFKAGHRPPPTWRSRRRSWRGTPSRPSCGSRPASRRRRPEARAASARAPRREHDPQASAADTRPAAGRAGSAGAHLRPDPPRRRGAPRPARRLRRAASRPRDRAHRLAAPGARTSRRADRGAAIAGFVIGGFVRAAPPPPAGHEGTESYRGSGEPAKNANHTSSTSPAPTAVATRIVECGSRRVHVALVAHAATPRGRDRLRLGHRSGERPMSGVHAAQEREQHQHRRRDADRDGDVGAEAGVERSC